VNTLAQEIGDLLNKEKLTLGTVESATGGLISHLITNISGSSAYFQGAIVSYSNEIKIKLAGVHKETLEKYGAVSPQVAEEMAEGGRKALKVDICIADTGIAGPTGATKNKPVGLFYLGLAHKNGVFNRKFVFHGSREQNKEQAALEALTWLKEYLIELNEKAAAASEFARKQIVTSFLENNGKVLILRRSNKVGTYQGRWAGISGYIETSADEQVYTEIREETGLDREDLKLIAKARPIEITDRQLKTTWIVHPYLFHVDSPDNIKIDWEHRESKWISPEDIGKYPTVPELKKTLAALMPELTPEKR
jgi:nicotinamide-nucleotide amidase